MIGKTGCGKSTLINAIYNYIIGLECPELGERTSWRYCIPMKRINSDNVEELVEAEAKYAHLHRENLAAASTGQSNTSEPTVFEFLGEDLTIRLVDTPGFADTGGLEKDAAHQKAILSSLCETQGINLFVIVWNEKRLTAEQRRVVNVMKEVLPRSSFPQQLLVCVTNTLEADAGTRGAITSAGLIECKIVCTDNLWVTRAEANHYVLTMVPAAQRTLQEIVEYAAQQQPIEGAALLCRCSACFTDAWLYVKVSSFASYKSRERLLKLLACKS
jgi:GTPase Era involved in 16S rRNA processing